MEKQRIKIEAEFMENIKPFAERMFNVAKQGYIVEAEFNKMHLSTEGFNNADEMLADLYKKEQEKEEKFKNSPEYEQMCQRVAAEVEAEFQQGEQVVAKFTTLDFDSIDSIVTWFLELADCREFYVRHYKIVEQLKEKGFLPLSELTIDFNMTAKEYIEVCPNLDEVGKYVISRAMESIIQLGFVSDHEAPFMKAYLLRSGNKKEQSLSRKNSKLNKKGKDIIKM